MPASDPFMPHCLPVDTWPRAWRDAWLSAFEAEDLFGEPKPATSWRLATVTKNRKGIGVFLSWCAQRGIDATGSVSTLVTRDRVAAYIADLRRSRAPYTVFCRVQELKDGLRILAPDGEYGWLAKVVGRLRAEATPVRIKACRLQSAQTLEEFGRALMERAEDDRLTPFQRALAYRDGLMIALLIRRPFRLKNFAELTLDEELVWIAGCPRLVFTAGQMKGKRPLEAPFPEPLLNELRHYLDVHRPFLLSLSRSARTGGPERALWISREGRRLAEGSLRTAIKKRTRARFGQDLTPHLFRDASVTSLVRDEPASARLTRVILGHASIDTTNRHYNQARMVETSIRHSALLDDLFGSDP